MQTTAEQSLPSPGVAAQTQPAEKAKKVKKQKKPRNKKLRKLIIWLVIIGAVVGYIGYSMYKAATYIPTVKTDTVGYQDIDSYLSTSATIRSSDSKAYFAPPQSKAVEVNFKAGDMVSAGDVIATFDLTELNNDVRLKQLAYENAKISYEDAQLDYDKILHADDERDEEIESLNEEIHRYNEKIKKIKKEYGAPPAAGEEGYEEYTRYLSKLMSAESERDALEDQKTKEEDITKAKNAMETAKNAVDSAQIDLATMQQYQKDNGIVAEFDGIITEMNLVEGGLSSNSSTACVVETTENLKAEFNISKYDIGTIKIGQKATLSLGNLTYSGTVSKIGAAAVKGVNSSGNATTAQVPAEITIDNPDANLIVGLEFDVDILTFSAQSVLSLPVEALLSDREGDFCYRLIATETPGVFQYEKVYVKAGNSSDTYVEVLEGVDEGDQVVLNPPTTIEMLPLVMVAPESAAGEGAASTDEAAAAA